MRETCIILIVDCPKSHGAKRWNIVSMMIGTTKYRNPWSAVWLACTRARASGPCCLEKACNASFLLSCNHALTTLPTGIFLADAMPSVVQGRISHDHATCTHAFAAAVCCANTMAPPICGHELPVSSNLHRQQRLLTNEALEGALGVG